VADTKAVDSKKEGVHCKSLVSWVSIVTAFALNCLLGSDSCPPPPHSFLLSPAFAHCSHTHTHTHTHTHISFVACLFACSYSFFYLLLMAEFFIFYSSFLCSLVYISLVNFSHTSSLIFKSFYCTLHTFPFFVLFAIFFLTHDTHTHSLTHTFTFTHSHSHRQTNRNAETNRQTDRQTDTLTDKQKNRYTLHRQTDTQRQTFRHLDRYLVS